MLAAIIAGAICAVFLIAALGYFIYRRRQASDISEEGSGDGMDGASYDDDPFAKKGTNYFGMTHNPVYKAMRGTYQGDVVIENPDFSTTGIPYVEVDEEGLPRHNTGSSASTIISLTQH
jgi:hypothetical protein